MNFDLDEHQQAVADLAEQILAGQTTLERVRAAEADGDFDRRLWAELAGADLLGLCLPESAGGSGMGPVELALLCQAQGRHVAPAPLLPTIAAAALLAAAGHDVSAAISGDAVLTAALAEPGVNDGRPTLTAEPAGDGWRLHGERRSVPYGQQAAVVLVPALAGGEVAVFAVPAGDGVRAEPVRTTDRQPAAHLDLDVAVPAAARVGDGAALDRLRRWWMVGQAATVLGLAEGALAQTAAYLAGRQQFGRPLATFQGAAHRAADAYITAEALRVCVYSAAWRLADGGEHGHDTTADCLIAAYWAAEGGQRITLAAQHLHGGIGADIDYPIHRYFLWATQLANSLGTASSHLAALGTHLATGARS